MCSLALYLHIIVATEDDDDNNGNNDEDDEDDDDDNSHNHNVTTRDSPSHSWRSTGPKQRRFGKPRLGRLLALAWSSLYRRRCCRHRWSVRFLAQLAHSFSKKSLYHHLLYALPAEPSDCDNDNDNATGDDDDNGPRNETTA